MTSLSQSPECIEHRPSALRVSGKFRSKLEARVAQEMNSLGVSWDYERRVRLPGGGFIPYLPDFSILASPPELKLPSWVECKPQEFLYELRGAMGIDRAYGDKFKNSIAVPGVDSNSLLGLGFKELSKPKRLAELSGECVLVVGRVGACESLSVKMSAEKIIFSRSHPFVNQVGVEKAKEREKRFKEAQERADSCRLQETASRQVLRIRNRLIVAKIINQNAHGRNKYPGSCSGCKVHFDAGKGFLFHACVDSPSKHFYLVCEDCIEAQ